MDLSLYRPLGFGAGTDVGGNYCIADIFGGDSISLIAKAYGRKEDRHLLLHLFDPNLTNSGKEVQPLLEDLLRARELSHPNLPSIEQISKTAGNALYLVYGKREVFALSSDISAASATGHTVEECIYFLYEIARSLQEAHRSEVLHLHLSPQNIYIGGAGELLLVGCGLGRAYGGDFGIDSSSYSQSYRAPEQIAGALGDYRSDIYSLGVIAYQLLVGLHPGSADQEPPQKLSDVASAISQAWLAELIDRMMERDPDKRITTIDEVLEVFEAQIPESQEQRRRNFLLARQARLYIPSDSDASGLDLLRERLTPSVMLAFGVFFFAIVALIALAGSESELGSAPLNEKTLAAKGKEKKSLSLIDVFRISAMSKEAHMLVGEAISGVFVRDSGERSGEKDYFNTAVGFGVSAPPGWNLNTTPKIDGSILSISKNTSDGVTDAEVSVSISSLYGDYDALGVASKMLRIFLSTLMQHAPRTLSEPRMMRLKNADAAHTSFVVSGEDSSEIYQLFVFQLDEKAVVFTLRLQGDTEGELPPELSSILNSFRRLSPSERAELNQDAARAVQANQEKINKIIAE